MALKLTKNELRVQQNRRHLLEQYLPTLQLKKALLQVEVNEAKGEILSFEHQFHQLEEKASVFAPLLSQPLSIDIKQGVALKEMVKRYENVAGVEVPHLESLEFEPFLYSLVDTPVWLDSVVGILKRMKELKIRLEIAREKKAALEKELHEVSIRVNLFEKVLIPGAVKDIKKIKTFLSDQQLAEVGRAKVAKSKIQTE